MDALSGPLSMSGGYQYLLGSSVYYALRPKTLDGSLIEFVGQHGRQPVERGGLK